MRNQQVTANGCRSGPVKVYPNRWPDYLKDEPVESRSSLAMPYIGCSARI
jgi:hypothetical protein